MFRRQKADKQPIKLKDDKLSKEIQTSYEQIYKSCHEQLAFLKKSSNLMSKAITLWKAYQKELPTDENESSLLRTLLGLLQEFSSSKLIDRNTLLDSIQKLVSFAELNLLSLEKQIETCSKMLHGKITDYYTMVLEPTNEVSHLLKIMAEFNKISSLLKTSLIGEFEKIFDYLGADNKQSKSHCRP